MSSPADPELIKQYSFLLFSKLEGAVTAGMVHLGDQLGLYRALSRAEDPLTTAELAEQTGLHERWVREWAYNQAAAKLIEVDAQERFSLSPEAVAVLATTDHPAFGMGMFHRLPETMQSLTRARESFVTGLGHDYDSHGHGGAIGIERSFEPWNRTFLLPVVLPALEGVVERLTAGATVIDIGCGAGSAVLLMAAAFPRSTFVGYDISQYALDRAQEKLDESGLANARFADPRHEAIADDHSAALVTTFDCVHDMTHPQEMMHSIRAALADDGTWLLVDIKAHDTFAENMRKNPMASLMYGVSVLSCMSSALSDPDGAGLGTLGLSATVAREMAGRAGFTRFRRLDVDHAVNAFYEVRP
jgi:2-polyprenyl-3-methyl-5-hydroxy-6-metoxy-1,4-benzoquinol methylase